MKEKEKIVKLAMKRNVKQVGVKQTRFNLATVPVEVELFQELLIPNPEFSFK